MAFNHHMWRSIREEVAEWLMESWEKWEEDRPDWFNESWINSVPADMIPSIGRTTSGGSKTYMRASFIVKMLPNSSSGDSARATRLPDPRGNMSRAAEAAAIMAASGTGLAVRGKEAGEEDEGEGSSEEVRDGDWRVGGGDGIVSVSSDAYKSD